MKQAPPAKPTTTCHPANDGSVAAPLALPVLRSNKPKKSANSKRRAWSLIIVHLLMIAHIAQWLITGRTISPVEPSETMYTLNYGYVNAGFLFFLLAISATLLLGRFVCGWGCHFIAYQDLCAWILRKLRIRPKPLRARLLLWAPLALALYMFVWPTVYRVAVGADPPTMINHIVTTDFWATFPGPIVAILTILVAGAGIVYFLGSKGFCTYACPYGGLFGLADVVAPGRIRVTDDCEQCGHCTSACTSNVRVHEEVATYGMVVDPGCMKCLDCVSVCPKNALYFGFGKPALWAEKKQEPPARPAYDFSLRGEVAFLLVGIAALLSYRSLYDLIPLLMAMAMAGMFGFAMLKSVQLLTVPHVRLQNLQLKRGGKWTGCGTAFFVLTAMATAITAHSGVVQFELARGRRALAQARLDDRIWTDPMSWAATIGSDQRAILNRAINHLSRGQRWGILATGTGMQALAQAQVAIGDLDAALHTVQQLVAARPRDAQAYRGLGNVLRLLGQSDQAVDAFETCMRQANADDDARFDYVVTLVDAGQDDQAAAVCRARSAPIPLEWWQRVGELFFVRQKWSQAAIMYREAVTVRSDNAQLRWRLGVALIQSGQAAAGIVDLRAAAVAGPAIAELQYDLGMALVQTGQIEDGIIALRKATMLRPQFAEAHYNLGVATFMAGRPQEAVPNVEQAIRLAPNDSDAYDFLALVLETIGDRQGASDARRRAAEAASQRDQK